MRRVLGAPRRRTVARRFSFAVGCAATLWATLSLLSRDASAQTFPPAASWVALSPTNDAAGDATPASRDIVGNAANPVAYVYSDTTHLYFRLRINGTGLASATDFTASNWGCLIDTDQDATDYEFSAIVDGAAALDNVRLWANTLQFTQSSPTDPPEILLKNYLGPLAVGQPGYGYARHVSAGSVFPVGTPDADFFVDWAVEWSAFGPTVNTATVLRFACGSGVGGNVLGSDFAGTASLPLLVSDPYLCNPSGCFAQTCPGFGQSCTIGIGQCASTGNFACSSPTQSYCSALIGEPSEEVCNGLDEDCDGVNDNGNPGSGVSCATGLFGVCSEGSTNCVSGALQCTPSITPGQMAETCNGLDDDCDGLTDEGFGIGTVCNVGLGVCKATGVVICDTQGGTTCSATPGQPSPETCNNLDDDCDGFIDDGDPGGGSSCSTGLLGACAIGVTFCSSGTVACTPTVLPGNQPETCNFADDDCDGVEDEELGLGQGCSVGVGACATSGSIICDGQGGTTCDAVPGTPGVEVCGDAIDGDCDGALDNGCPDTDGDGIIDAIEEQIGTDPLDADTDDDGVPDGEETDPSGDADGDGLINALDCDSDNDGLYDGTETGRDCKGPGTDASKGHCIADADGGLTKTDPLDPDTDDGGVRDGSEDWNHDGKVDPGETDPTAGNGADDSSIVDSDGDGLSDEFEEFIGSNPHDADSDDDGLLDGEEANPADDTDGDGLVNVLDPDSDDDGLWDGTELGKDCSNPDTNPAAKHCKVDLDGGVLKTSPVAWDTDGGGVSDGSEDRNLNGRNDIGEQDPTLGNAPDDTLIVDSDGDGLSDALEQFLGSNPNDADSDDDGVLDGAEHNPADDTDGDGKKNVLDPDSDNDGLWDGTEDGKDCSNPATNVAAGHCIADADPSTRTSPLLSDTDKGGISDGAEDLNKNGKLDAGETDPTKGHPEDDPVDSDGDGLLDKVEKQIGTDPFDADSDDDGVPDGDEPSPGIDSDGDGLINALDPDSDNDGLKDGTEMGRGCSGPGTNTAAGNCVPDADNGQTVTDPLDWDTDDGGASDGAEDINKNGKIDAGETNPTVGHGGDDPKDSDGDGLLDADENEAGTDPFDKDSDDDGVPDGEEPSWNVDSDGDGLINALDPDSDNDGLKDGTEMGRGCSGPGTNTAAGNCVPDADNGLTKTDPLDWDTDDGSVSDGSEDTNLDGKIDPGETDPTAGHGADDVSVPDSDGDGLSDPLEATLGSDPNDADTDDDGLLDGEEPNPGEDADGDGIANILDSDSDGDGLFDGLEMGKDCSNPATDVTKMQCIVDLDMGMTKTSPLDPDTDDGGITDGGEDSNHNGIIDAGETDPTAGHGSDDRIDTDGDGLFDPDEISHGTDPNDADSDDDGVPDGQEVDPFVDSDGDGVINALDPDSDNDGILDGTEMGYDCSSPATDTTKGNCVPDADKGATKTDPLDPDTDDGGVKDGDEDKNHNGVIDAGETDPLDPSDDVPTKPCTVDEDCGDAQSGMICVDGTCVEGCRGEGGNGCPDGQECNSTGGTPGQCVPSTPGLDPGDVRVAGSGCLCSTKGAGEGDLGGVLALVSLGVFVIRRRRRA